MNASESPGKPGQAGDFSVIIPSARAANLVPCVRALLAHEPELPPERIVVVDDGARAEAEPQLPGLRWVPGVKPFVYARNINRGIRAVDTDVILLNDDALLVTPRGLSLLVEQARSRPNLGACSAGVSGYVGIERQYPTGRSEFRDEPYVFAFICVYLPRSVFQSIGPLDERFTAYGLEDKDYCTRILKHGLTLGIWDGCVVDHTGVLVSTYRSRPDYTSLLAHNHDLFVKKWGKWDPLGRSDDPVDPPPQRYALLQRLKRLLNGDAFGLRPERPDGLIRKRPQ
jgi:GT2 family glycosyltransferase